MRVWVSGRGPRVVRREEDDGVDVDAAADAMRRGALDIADDCAAVRVRKEVDLPVPDARALCRGAAAQLCDAREDRRRELIAREVAVAHRRPVPIQCARAGSGPGRRAPAHASTRSESRCPLAQ